jgi:hypothetical protein
MSIFISCRDVNEIRFLTCKELYKHRNVELPLKVMIACQNCILSRLQTAQAKLPIVVKLMNKFIDRVILFFGNACNFSNFDRIKFLFFKEGMFLSICTRAGAFMWETFRVTV